MTTSGAQNYEHAAGERTTGDRASLEVGLKKGVCWITKPDDDRVHVYSAMLGDRL